MFIKICVYVLLLFLSCSIPGSEEVSVTKIMQLADSIYERLYYEIGNGVEILSDVTAYYNDLKLVLVEVENDTFDGEVLYLAIKKTYGPIHLKVPYPSYYFLKIYGLTWEETERMEKILEDTLHIWWKIEKVATTRSYGITTIEPIIRTRQAVTLRHNAFGIA